jgi:hypothetical protein
MKHSMEQELQRLAAQCSNEMRQQVQLGDTNTKLYRMWQLLLYKQALRNNQVHSLA